MLNTDVCFFFLTESTICVSKGPQSLTRFRMYCKHLLSLTNGPWELIWMGLAGEHSPWHVPWTKSSFPYLKGHFFGGRLSSVSKWWGGKEYGPARQIKSNQPVSMVWEIGNWLPLHPYCGGWGEGRVDTVDTEGEGQRCSLRPRAPLSCRETRLFQSYFIYRKSDYLRFEYRNRWGRPNGGLKKWRLCLFYV